MAPLLDEGLPRQRSDSLSTTASISNSVARSSCSSAASTRFQPPQCLPPSITLFDRDEIRIGKLLGQGRFSRVSEVLALDLKKQKDDNDENDDSSSYESDDTSAFERRQELVEPKRLAVKHLHARYLQTASPKEFRNAVADLVLEALYLSTLDHPNIVKLKGLTRGGTSVLWGDTSTIRQADRYFLIMDRLEETLGQRLTRWKEQRQRGQLVGADSVGFMQHKVVYALQMADALRYLHSKNIIFRDLKPQNVGLLGDTIQLFDFGLARELPETSGCGCVGGDLPTKNSRLLCGSFCSSCDAGTNDSAVHPMSASGTRRYMAPEIFTAQKYNLKADVYSWAMVYYEILALEKPYAGFSHKHHAGLVCCLGGRPKLSAIHWPVITNGGGSCDDDMNQIRANVESLLHQTWAHDPTRRLSIEAAHGTIQGIWEQLEEVRQRCDEQTPSIPEAPAARALAATTPTKGAKQTSPDLVQKQDTETNPILPPRQNRSPNTTSQAA